MGIWKTISTESNYRGLTLLLSTLLAAGGLYAYFKPSTPAATQTELLSGTAIQRTSGENSPIITGNTGSVSYAVGASPAASAANPSKLVAK